MKRNRGELDNQRPSDEPSEDRLSCLVGIRWQAERYVQAPQSDLRLPACLVLHGLPLHRAGCNRNGWRAL